MAVEASPKDDIDELNIEIFQTSLIPKDEE